MKTLRVTSAVALVLTLFLSLGTLTAAAQGPTGSTSSSVANLDNSTHTIPAAGSQLFQFNYSVDNQNNTRPVTTIRLLNGLNSGINFEVWTADELNALAASTGDPTQPVVHPIGQGTAVNVDCNTGEISGSGACQSPDLVWSGAFGSSGTYYVRVINNNNAQSSFQLNIQGSGVSLGQQQTASAPKAPAAASAPAAAPALAAITDDPNKGAAINGQLATLPAGKITWYRFDYAVDLQNNVHPTATIRLLNGLNRGINFEVWTADELRALAASAGDPTQPVVHPIGQGTAVNVDCNTGEISGSGGCQSPDLVWSGAFGAPDTYYVRVINNNNNPTNYQLTINQTPIPAP